jgi:hypothetical protein
MRMFSLKSAVAFIACFGLLVLAGCKHDQNQGDESQPHAAPQTASVPSYSIKDEKGVKYAVLAQGSVITQNLDQWHALNPEFFTRLSGIAVTVPAEVSPQPGYSYGIPHIEANPEHPEQKIGRLAAGYLVPKELHGWVAVDQKTFAELIKKFMAQ